MSKKSHSCLKLKNNFYNTDSIKLLEALPNGYEYSSLYLKLCLVSLKKEGKLTCNPEILAKITGHNIDIIRMAIDAFINLDMVSILGEEMFIDDILEIKGSGK